MAGTFDSNVTSLGFYEGSIASSVATLTGTNAYVLPYDIEVVSAGIVGSTGAAAQFIHADVQVIPVGTTTATSLFSLPSAAANIASVRLDQSYVTLNTIAATTSAIVGTSTAGTTTVNVTTGQGSRFAIGQGIVVVGSNTAGNYITNVSTDALTLAKPVTYNNGAAVASFTTPTPQPGQQIQILGITDPFWRILVNSTTGAPGVTTYTVVDSTEATTGQSFRVGPLKQAGLYNTTTGFWEFTKPLQTLSAGTFQILDAVVLPGAAIGTVTNATYNYPDVINRVDAGSTLRVIWKGITSTGAVRTTTVTSGSITLSLAVKKR